MRNSIEQDVLFIPISGALTPKVSLEIPHPLHLPFSLLHPDLKFAILTPVNKQFGNLRKALHDRHFKVAHPIVLPKLGIQDPNNTHDYVMDKTQERLKDNKAHKAWLIALSYGGKIAARAVAEDPSCNMVLGAYTGDSPHNGANEEAFTPLTRWLRRANRLGLIDIDEEGLRSNDEAFGQITCDLAAQHETDVEGRLYQVGVNDKWVPIDSALHPIPGGTRTHIGQSPIEELGENVAYLPSPKRMTHVGAVGCQLAVDYSIETALSSIEHLRQAA